MITINLFKQQLRLVAKGSKLAATQPWPRRERENKRDNIFD